MNANKDINMLFWELEQMHAHYASQPKIGMNAMHQRAARTMAVVKQQGMTEALEREISNAEPRRRV